VIRPGYFQRLARLGTGALVLFVVQGICAPGSARAGCSHATVARNDPGGLQSIVDSFLVDLAGPIDGYPARPPSRPCSGVFCSGEPATPAVPAGEFDLQADSWAWCASGSVRISGCRAFYPSGHSAPHSIVRISGIFHPPRLVASFS
jgi:hypothetical protein